MDSFSMDTDSLPSHLYTLCLWTLRYLLRRSAKQHSPILRESLARLALWGEAFEDGALEKALGLSYELKETALQLLNHLGKKIIQVATLLDAHLNDRPNEMDQLERIVGDIEHTTTGNIGHKSPLSDEWDDESIINNDFDDYTGEDRARLYDDIQFDILCLTDLSTSLEQNLSRLIEADTPPFAEASMSIDSLLPTVQPPVEQKGEGIEETTRASKEIGAPEASNESLQRFDPPAPLDVPVQLDLPVPLVTQPISSTQEFEKWDSIWHTIQSEDSTLQWHCHICRAGPHWCIFERVDGIKACRRCAKDLGARGLTSWKRDPLG